MVLVVVFMFRVYVLGSNAGAGLNAATPAHHLEITDKKDEKSSSNAIMSGSKLLLSLIPMFALFARGSCSSLIY